MANIVFNIAKGRVVEYYNRVTSNDPANSALVIVPIETSGLESDATLGRKHDLAAVLSGTTNEQTTMGRKTLTNVDLAALPAPDDVNDRYEVSLPTVLWTAVTGSSVSKLIVGFIPDTTSFTDADIVPLTMFDFPVLPSGADVQMTGAVFARAQQGA